jgi:hypothetical protein
VFVLVPGSFLGGVAIAPDAVAGEIPMIVYRHHGLRIGLTYFDEEPDAVKVDVLYLFQQSGPVSGAVCEEHRTLVVDLRRSSEELMAALEKDTAYEIRRAQKDGVVCEYPDARQPAVRNEFWSFFRRFSEATDLAAPGETNLRIFHAMGDAGAIELAAAKDRNGTILAYHCYRRGKTAGLLAPPRPLHRLAHDGAPPAPSGRGHPVLFWSDLLHFKTMEMNTYDFGGWYQGDTDEHLLRINRFKEAFGGRVVPIYNCRRGCTLVGKIAVWLKQLRGR